MQRSPAGTSIWDDGNAKLDRSQSLPGTEATAVYVSLVEPTEADREIERLCSCQWYVTKDLFPVY